MNVVFRLVSLLAAMAALGAPAQDSTEPLRLAVVGLEHGHVEGALWNAANRDDIELVGVWSDYPELWERLAAKYGLDPLLHYDDLEQMLDEKAPEAASVMTSTAGHLDAVAACAQRGVHVLVEKPLDFDIERARLMAEIAQAENILLLTNFETSWYRSVSTAKQIADDRGTPIRRAVFRHGHKGPAEIGCSADFLSWLTDPVQNGGGAITDFGCYGAVIMTWLMDGERPTSVHAVTQQLKPELYPDVDDDATIVLTYPGATAVIQASWAWTHDNKDMDLHAEGFSLHAGKWDDLTLREADSEAVAVGELIDNSGLENEWTYLRRVVRGESPIDPLSSLELNLIATEILDAARESARTGRAVELN
ncbi:MAG: Gfo/Idh/MocA family oxidoreductase [Planctomycetota bacterium]